MAILSFIPAGLKDQISAEEQQRLLCDVQSMQPKPGMTEVGCVSLTQEGQVRLAKQYFLTRESVEAIFPWLGKQD